MLFTQIQGLSCPTNCELSSVQVFSSLDGELALNIFTFQTLNAGKKVATADDMAAVKSYINDLKAGRFAGLSGIPTYDDSIFSDDAMDSYRQRIRPAYAVSVCFVFFFLYLFLTGSCSTARLWILFRRLTVTPEGFL